VKPGLGSILLHDLNMNGIGYIGGNPPFNSPIFQLQTMVNELRDHPDSNLIASITQLTIQNINLAETYANLIIGKLTHPETLGIHRRPLFYLIDYILKKTGGPYPMLFLRALSDVFSRAIAGISDEDRDKLIKLLGTWNERRLFPQDILLKWKEILVAGRSKVCISFLQTRIGLFNYYISSFSLFNLNICKKTKCNFETHVVRYD
jgi:hypothetical protein